jgi:hypothetical protein
VWVNVVGRPKIRTGVPSMFTVNYGNSGKVDAYFTGLTVTLPANISATYDLGVSSDVMPSVQTPTAVSSNGQSVIPMIIPPLAAGASGSFNMMITDATDGDNYTITANIGHPWYSSSQAAVTELTAQSTAFTPATTCAASPTGETTVGSCLGEYLTNISNAGASATQVQGVAASLLSMLQQSQVGFTPTISSGTTYASGSQLETGTLVVSGVPSFDNYVLFHVKQTSAQYLVPITTTNCVPDSDNVDDAIGGTFLVCTFNNVMAPQQDGVVIAGESLGLGIGASITPEPDACFTVSQNIAPTTFTISTRASEICGTGQAQDYPYKDPGDQLPPFIDPGLTDPGSGPTGGSSAGSGGTTGGSIDPNAKSGATGDRSASQYVAGSLPLPYTVYFENEATATLPAANVIVTDQLDPTKVNLSSLTLGSVSFGANMIPVPFNVNNFNTTYKVNSSLSVRIQGSLDLTSGLLKWTFTSIDPTTGLPPTDPTVGFLPPDTDGIVGQGSVTFNVMPAAEQSTGTQIANQASVVFDSNAAIVTATWTNTLDVDAPVSKVAALPATAPKTGTTTPFTVTWSGTDVGSGIATYTIYVSDNGGPFTVWQGAVTTTSAVYNGQTNHTCGFYSIAKDGAGNVEAAKTTAEASIEIVGAGTTTALMVTPTNPAPGQMVTLTATVTAAAGSSPAPTGTVTFFSGTTSLGIGTVGTSGVATLTTTMLPSGSDAITAQYGGDSNFDSSTSAAVTVTVALTSTVTMLGTSAASANVGTNVTFTASVSPSSGSGTPTGTVTFYNGTTILGTGTIAGGAATFSTSTLAAGTYSITATYGGDMNFASSTSTAIQQVIVSPSFTLAFSPSSLTITAGQSGTSTLTVTPTGGFNQSISLACSGLPAHATCTFSPAAITPAGGSVTSTLTVATDVASAELHRPDPQIPGSHRGQNILAAFLLAGIGSLVRLRRHRGRTWQALRLMLLLPLLLGFAATAFTGCGGANPNTTPTGTSTVTVTATAGTQTQSATLTVVIH